MSERAPTPAEIVRALETRVIGQPRAVEEMAVALAKKLAGLTAGNILLIGASGSGKTTLMRAVEEYLAAMPEAGARSLVVRIHANLLAEEAQRGRAGSAVLDRLMSRLRQFHGVSVSRAEAIAELGRGIVFVDEVDKIRARVGAQPNTAGIRAQEALLTLIENEAVPFELPAAFGGDTVSIDSRGLLFVCAGAFEGLYDSVYDRVTVGEDRGALKSVTHLEEGGVREELDFHLRDWLRLEDLFDYGMSPQFLSRFDALVLLEQLTVDDLVRIFLESPDSGYQAEREFFHRQGVELAMSPAAVRRIAREAARQPRLGARALKEVFRRVVRDLELEPQERAEAGVLMVDEPEVEAALGS